MTISLWKWIPTEGVQIDSVVEAWEKEHPEIHLDITHVGEAAKVFQKYSAALPAGEGPTILAMQVGARANQFKDFCEPLAPYAVEKWGADWEDMFLDTALEQCRWSGDDYTVLPGGMTAAPAIEAGNHRTSQDTGGFICDYREVQSGRTDDSRSWNRRQRRLDLPRRLYEHYESDRTRKDLRRG